ncbi:hypothetical protein [Halapricum desulfuricans]|nr:hypothetical protein [Halapricum desulfuricans]
MAPHTDNIDKMNEYSDLADAARMARKAALEADDEVDGLRWIAAGGRGNASLRDLKGLGEALERNGKAIQELVEEAPEPRRLRDGETDD